MPRSSAARVAVRPLPTLLLALLCWPLVAAWHAGTLDADTLPLPAREPATWRNPVIARNFPDPTVARFGDTYWASSTSSSLAAGFPLMHSPDLVHWTQSGAVFPTPPAWTAGSLWAPELVNTGAGARVYYTARRRNGPLCVAVATAPSPAGPYTDHGPLRCDRVGSIDPTVATDPHGRQYLLWKEDGNSAHRPSRIWIQRLRADGLAVVGRRHLVLRNEAPWEGRIVEAPEVVTHGRYVYLIYSGNLYGGRSQCRYALGVARARSLLGPWTRAPRNPILASNRAWLCPGHASIVDDGQGHDFLLYHAYAANPRRGRGRLALLDPLRWGRDGWPQINRGGGPSLTGRL